MSDSNDTTNRPTRRNVLKATGGALAGLGGVMAANPASAQEPSLHRKFGRLNANITCDRLNNSLCDYVDTISDYSDDPDHDPVDCSYVTPDEVCDYLKTIDQSWNHYLNTVDWDGREGNADRGAADNAEDARSRVNNNDYVEAAIKSGRSLHFIQDIGTLVHTGREGEQASDRDIHYDFEDWVDNNWDNYFKDRADTTGYMSIDEKDDIEYWAWENAEMSHSRLEDQWYDIKYSGYYYDSTKEAQGWSVYDASHLSNGTLQWVWENA